MEWILDLEQQGFVPSHAETREMAERISRNSGGPPQVGKHWLSRFLGRHSSIKNKIGRKIDALRVKNTDSQVLRTWFVMVERLFIRYRFRLENIYNINETGCCLNTCIN